MRIVADRNVCIGSGQCVFADEDAFDQDDEGKVVVIRQSPEAPDQVAAARQAVDICPSRALKLVEH